jgi:hypothetical protein
MVPMQDWAFLHSCLVLDSSNTSDSIGPIDILHGTPNLVERSQSSLFNSITKSSGGI